MGAKEHQRKRRCQQNVLLDRAGRAVGTWNEKTAWFKKAGSQAPSSSGGYKAVPNLGPTVLDSGMMLTVSVCRAGRCVATESGLERGREGKRLVAQGCRGF
ncbi:hypothetical protein CT0861_06745 [Colletotrichum tofieldiae]|uniref:Uncharacterized protein n=1 Tax=Colletotrichum tofieldiae TaxID=708197 RepID=A0A166TLJ8_9PEZI|nr:hypothetical protein CT0861_06745 [Colletotrichum tofieldiae]